MSVQSIVFNKRYYTVNTARDYLKRNGYRWDDKIDETPKTYRFRQLPPKFKNYLIRKKGAVSFVIGYD